MKLLRFRIISLVFYNYILSFYFPIIDFFLSTAYTITINNRNAQSTHIHSKEDDLYGFQKQIKTRYRPEKFLAEQ